MFGFFSLVLSRAFPRGQYFVRATLCHEEQRCECASEQLSHQAARHARDDAWIGLIASTLTVGRLVHGTRLITLTARLRRDAVWKLTLSVMS